jgi:large subunit ribosomal protein L25
MKVISINAQKRTELGKKATRILRKEGHVPCVIYGGAEVIHFHAHENDFRNLIYSHEAYIIEIKINESAHKAVIQELQFHPVTDRLNHIDFVEVSDNKPVTMDIPIRLTGASIGIKNGGKPRQRRRVLKVRGLIDHLPDTLDIDITDVEIGDVIKIGDLTFENLEILDPKRSMIFAVVSSRVSMKGMEIIEPEAEVAEGEEKEEKAKKAEAHAEASAEEDKEEES